MRTDIALDITADTGEPFTVRLRERRALYVLYRVLDHLDLFGGSCVRQAEGMAARRPAAV